MADTYIEFVRDQVTAAERSIDAKINERQHENDVQNQHLTHDLEDLNMFSAKDTNLISKKYECSVKKVTVDKMNSRNYLSIDDIDTLYKSLQFTKDELTAYRKKNTNLDKNQKEQLKELKKKTTATIKKIQSYYQIQKQYEQNLFQEFRKALESDELGAIKNLNIRFIQSQKDIRSLTKDIMNKTHDLEDLLNKIKRVEDLTIAVVGTEFAYEAGFHTQFFDPKIKDSKYKQIEYFSQKFNESRRELIFDRLKTGFHHGQYLIKTSRFIGDLYAFREGRYSQEVLLDLLQRLDANIFLIGDESYLADVTLLLDLNLQLILRQKCNPDIFHSLYPDTAVHKTRKYYRKLRALIDLIKFKYSENQSVKSRLDILSDLVLMYEVKGAPIIKACGTLQEIDSVVLTTI